MKKELRIICFTLQALFVHVINYAVWYVYALSTWQVFWWAIDVTVWAQNGRKRAKRPYPAIVYRVFEVSFLELSRNANVFLKFIEFMMNQRKARIDWLTAERAYLMGHSA